jgi:hypothetical protein
MGKRIGSERIERDPTFLYFVGKDGFVWRTPTVQNKSGKKGKVGTEKVEKKPGYLYYLDDEGFVAEAKMKHA